MIKHLLDVHHMNIEADIEDFRDYFHASADTGTPLNAAVHRQNMPALLALLDRGADSNKAIWQSISRVIVTPWLPAVSPLLDAGADPTDAFEDAVDHLNFAAAKVCLEKGANPTGALRAQQAKAAKKASGAWDREWYEYVEGNGGDSEGDDEEVSVKREGMRRVIREAGDARMGRRVSLWGFLRTNALTRNPPSTYCVKFSAKSVLPSSSSAATEIVQSPLRINMPKTHTRREEYHYPQQPSCGRKASPRSCGW
jgi:hypothetical protein